MLMAKTVIHPGETTDRITLAVTIGSSEKITDRLALIKAVLRGLHAQAEAEGLISLASDGITTEIRVQEVEP
ncbi:hypothetical protein [Synechococcus sp. PCC 6312]|uniref:hypothetical protein n=1 Tax=Synechococcus sp. (strain ATCC 27167 / PCC 6312) TaxID=195253 RepID=UPI00029F3DC6|nr:hypothetical protein [Synechococcus sp. PCC 6312]AFY60844.1 hypothetical protein Syn6312_1688 [Synechococcus sp. PCC 6312]